MQICLYQNRPKQARLREIKFEKRKIVKYTLIAAGVAEIASLPAIGPDIDFIYGLALGTAIGIVNTHLLATSVEHMAESRKKAFVTIGYFVRLALYAVALCAGAFVGTRALAGSAIGVLLPKAAILLIYAIVPWFLVKTGKTPKAMYVTDTRSRVFERQPMFVKYSCGRLYMTHRRFRIVKAVPVQGAGNMEH